MPLALKLSLLTSLLPHSYASDLHTRGSPSRCEEECLFLLCKVIDAKSSRLEITLSCIYIKWWPYRSTVTSMNTEYVTALSVHEESACLYKTFVIVTLGTHIFSETLCLLCLGSFCIQLAGVSQGQDKIKKIWEGLS